MNKFIGLFLTTIVMITVLGSCFPKKWQGEQEPVQVSGQLAIPAVDSTHDFLLPPVVDLFQFHDDYSSPFMVDYRIWGWTRDGRAAYSVTGHDGGITTLYFNIVDYFSPDSRFISYSENFDDFNVDEDGYHLDVDGNRIDFNDIYRDFYNVCNENGIEFISTEYKRLPIIHNNRTYNVNLVLSKQEIDGIDIVESYRLIAETQEDRFIYTAQDGYAYDVFLLGYFLSPFGNRVLLAMGKYVFGAYITDFFVGLDLDNGFTATAETAPIETQSNEEQPIITIGKASGNIPGDYHFFAEDQMNEKIIFRTTESLDSFVFIEIYPHVDPNEDLFLISGDVIFGVDDFTPDMPLVVSTSIGSGIPSRGIRIWYRGEERAFYITESGMDGSLLLIEFTPYRVY